MSFTNYLAAVTLDHIFGLTAIDTGAMETLYIALSTTTPVEDGTNFTEPEEASGYTRVAFTNNKTNWSIATGSIATNDPLQIHNMEVITFAQADSGEGWGTITDFGIYSGVTVGGGTGLAFGTLSTPKSVAVNDTASFASGALEITLD